MSVDRMKERQTQIRRRRQKRVYTIVLLYLVAITAFSVLSLVKCIQLRRDIEKCLEMVEELSHPIEEATEEPKVAPSVEYKELVNISESEPVEGTVSEELEEPKALKTITVTATAYCPCPSCCGIWSEQHPSRIGTDYQQVTASGAVPTEGRTIATDPDVIPTGTHVLINGHEYVAEDTGGAIKGNKIDIFFNTHEDALNWGRQTVEVTILE